MHRVVPLLAITLLLAACGEQGPEVMGPQDPTDVIQDGNQNGGNKAFFWLAPMVSNNVYSGVFNPRLKPQVVICELNTAVDPAVCGSDLASWTMETGLRVSTVDEHYAFEWHTDQTSTDFTATYRIQVFLTDQPGAERLGFADVQFFSNGQELKNINTGETIALRDGRTLPVHFRIEEGVSCDAQTDCGEAVIGPGGGTVTTEAGYAGVEVPAGAVNGDILITIRRVEVPVGGRCLPTGLRQEEGCYEFDTEPSLAAVNQNASTDFPQGRFIGEVVVGVCPDPAAERDEYLTLHKFDPEHVAQGVVELPGAVETFLTCDGFAFEPESGPFSRFATAVRGVLSPVGRLLAPSPLHARDTGRGGTTEAFSYIGWAEPVDINLVTAPTAVLPGQPVQVTVQTASSHTHGVFESGPAPGTTLRFVYTDPAGVETVLPAVTTDVNGEASPSWTLTNVVGVHTLSVSTWSEALINSQVVLVADQTTLLPVEVGGYNAADECDGITDCGQGVIGSDGGVVTTEPGLAGVSVPEGALDGDILITVKKVDPATLPGGRCLPTQVRQENTCYDFDTEPALGAVNQQDAFNSLVVVGICPDPNAPRQEYTTLHKYDPENPQQGVVELAGAQAPFLTCGPVIGSTSGAGGPIMAAARALLKPVRELVLPAPLYARDTGRGGTTEAFSRITWAERVNLTVGTVPTQAAVGDVLTIVLSASTAHTHVGAPVTDASGTGVLAEWTDPSGSTSLLINPGAVVTGSTGDAQFPWDLANAVPGTHTLRITTRDLDDGVVIQDVTTPQLVTVEVVSPTGTISGFVRDAQNAGIPGASVVVVGTQIGALTDANGAYQLASVPAGAVTVSASSIGFIGATQQLTVVGGQSYNVDFQLAQPGSISGGVYDQYENSLSGATVTVVGANLTTTSGADGSYSFGAVAPGTYTLQASPQSGDLQTEQVNVTVPDGGSVSQDFYLEYLTGSISGTATQAGDPVSGLSVTLSGNGVQGSTSTNAQGAFSFLDVPVGSGYTVTASASGWSPDSETVTVFGNQTTAVSLVLQVLTVDQASTSTNGTTSNDPGGSVLQSFTPSASSLAAVRLRFRTDGNFPTAGTTTQVRIRQGAYNGTVIGTADAQVTGAPGATLEPLFQLPNAISVDPGSTYFIEWVSQSQPLSWFVSDTDVYQGGAAYNDSGSPLTYDFVFWTYY